MRGISVVLYYPSNFRGGCVCTSCYVQERSQPIQASRWRKLWIPKHQLPLLEPDRRLSGSDITGCKELDFDIKYLQYWDFLRCPDLGWYAATDALPFHHQKLMHTCNATNRTVTRVPSGTSKGYDFHQTCLMLLSADPQRSPDGSLDNFLILAIEKVWMWGL